MSIKGSLGGGYCSLAAIFIILVLIFSNNASAGSDLPTTATRESFFALIIATHDAATSHELVVKQCDRYLKLYGAANSRRVSSQTLDLIKIEHYKYLAFVRMGDFYSAAAQARHMLQA